VSKRIVVEPAAAEELRRAIRRYEDERVGLGAELADVVEAAFQALATGARRSVTVPWIPNELGVRRVLLKRFPFAIIHVDDDDAVRVIAIAHLRRRPGYWRSRMPSALRRR
jgi:toxin ParE1/3/4